MRSFRMQMLPMVLLLCAPRACWANWVSLDFPGAWITKVHGVDGGTVVGEYTDHSGTHGFIHEGATWTPLAYPGAVRTEARGIDAGKVVGSYTDSSSSTHGFIYDGTGWTTIDYPAASGTWVTGIDGDNLVGVYDDGVSGGLVFRYDGNVWATITALAAAESWFMPQDIDGENIVGSLMDVGGDCETAFVWDGSAMTRPAFLGTSPCPHYESADGIDDARIIGDKDGRGFFYDGATLMMLDFPGAIATYPHGIDGDRIVGQYADAAHELHGFVYTIPEPGTVLLLGLGGLGLLRRRRTFP